MVPEVDTTKLGVGDATLERRDAAPTDEEANREGGGTFNDINGAGGVDGGRSVGFVAAWKIFFTSVCGALAADGGGRIGGGGGGREGGGGGGGSSRGTSRLAIGEDAEASMSSALIRNQC